MALKNIYKLMTLPYVSSAWISVLNSRYIQLPICYLHWMCNKNLKLNQVQRELRSPPHTLVSPTDFTFLVKCSSILLVPHIKKFEIVPFTPPIQSGNTHSRFCLQNIPSIWLLLIAPTITMVQAIIISHVD